MTLDAHRVAEKLWIGASPGPADVAHFDAVFLCAREFQPRDLPCRTYAVLMDDSGAAVLPAELHRSIGAAKLAHQITEKGGRVLMACAQGVNRSSFVAAQLLMRRGYSCSAAIALIRETRSPRCGMMPLCGPAFVRALQEIEGRR